MFLRGFCYTGPLFLIKFIFITHSSLIFCCYVCDECRFVLKCVNKSLKNIEICANNFFRNIGICANNSLKNLQIGASYDIIHI